MANLMPISIPPHTGLCRLREKIMANKKENTMANTAIVTGASRGIGRSIARRLASDGLSVVVNNAGSVKDAEETVSEIKSAGGHAVAVAGDISQANDVSELFARAAQAFGPIQVVVNSDSESFDKVISINLRGAFFVLAQAAQHVIQGGRIVALSSSVIAKSFPTYGAYIASKAGVEGLVHVLANELRGRNITVNAVAPGAGATGVVLKGQRCGAASA